IHRTRSGDRRTDAGGDGWQGPDHRDRGPGPGPRGGAARGAGRHGSQPDARGPAHHPRTESMRSGEAGDEYFRAVEEEFVRRRGAAMLLSPRDWSLIGEWQEAGVPLRVVLQAINNIFDAFER